MEINNVEPDVLHFTSVYASKVPKTDILWKILHPEFKFKLIHNKTKGNQDSLPSAVCDTSPPCIYIGKMSFKSSVCP